MLNGYSTRQLNETVVTTLLTLIEVVISTHERNCEKKQLRLVVSLESLSTLVSGCLSYGLNRRATTFLGNSRDIEPSRHCIPFLLT
jgi:hypothetical protein